MSEHFESARRLREALLEAGISQQELAKKSGVNKASISQYINGTHIPGNKKAGALAEVLGVRPQWLMCLDDYKYEDEFNPNVDFNKRMAEYMSRLVIRMPVKDAAEIIQFAQIKSNEKVELPEFIKKKIAEQEQEKKEKESKKESAKESKKESNKITVYNPNMKGKKNGK